MNARADDTVEIPSELIPPMAGEAPPKHAGPSEEPLTDSEKIAIAMAQLSRLESNVNWLCQQVYAIIQAASNLPGIGGMMVRKGMKQ